MRNRSFIVSPTALATQLSAISGRPVVAKELPVVTSRGRPVILRDAPGAFGNAKRASLKAAVEAFNRGEAATAA